jgi:hypothetical protein
MTISIRPGRPGDVAHVLELWSAADAEPSHTDDAYSLAALVAHDPAALVVAEEHERIVGSVIAAWDGWRGSVYRLVVAPSHRRQGSPGDWSAMPRTGWPRPAPCGFRPSWWRPTGGLPAFGAQPIGSNRPSACGS